MPDITSVVNKVRAGKLGGVSAVTFDCYIYGTESVYVFIAILLHGIIPNDFWCRL